MLFGFILDIIELNETGIFFLSEIKYSEVFCFSMENITVACVINLSLPEGI